MPHAIALPASGKQIVDDLAVHVGQPEVASGITVRELLVIEA
jgi:hypothetical protein